MNKQVMSTILCLTATSIAVGAPLTDHTFIAHRDELSYQALEWITNNHCRTQKTSSRLGALFTVTPFYSVSTNKSDLAKLFGIGKTSAIDVTGTALTGDTFTTIQSQALYSFNIDHAPNADGATAGFIPMHGKLTLAPERRSYGAYLSWDQSFDNIAKGLRARITIPVVDAQTSLQPDDSTATASYLPATDGATGKTLKDYFSGALSKGISTHSHVNQQPLKRGKISNDFVHAFGLADIKLNIDWQCYTHEKFNCVIGGSIQLPAGNTVSGEYLLEPIIGARGHVAAGLNGLLQIHAYKSDKAIIRVDACVDMSYFFEGTERRMVSVFDKTDAVIMPASPYRLVMRNKYAGVQPAANVMSLDHTVNPGFQLDGLLGVSTSFKNVTIDLGYNLYWHQEEKLALKNTNSWIDDQYAFAHNHYSMYGSVLGKTLVGGTYLNGGGNVVHTPLTDNANASDPNSAVAKHKNLIGANRDGWSTPVRVTDANRDNADYWPGEFTSMNGPIQNAGKNQSLLIRQEVTTAANDTNDRKAGVGLDTTGTAPVRYTITSDYAKTAAQITHSIVGGIGYKTTGEKPLVVGVGGLYEFQEGNRNSALENVKVWAKLGIQF